MDAMTLIEQAQSIGLTLTVTGGDLSITGRKTKAAAALVQSMAPFKADIIAALTQPSQRPPLPADKWVTGFATFAEARKVQRELAERYVVHCGMGEAGFYVAGPNSGLCAVHVPYKGATDDTGERVEVTAL